MSIPWRFTTDFNEQKHLFYEKITTDYELEAFSCSCGHIDFAIRHAKEYFKYICPKCDNIDFYDANIAWKNIDHFLYKNENLELSFDYDVSNNEDGLSLSYVTLIPNSIDFLQNKIIFSKKSIYSLKVTVDGDIKKEFKLKYNDKIFTQLEKKLVRYINKHKFFNIPYPTDDMTSLKKIKFFLKHKHLKDISFYRWKDIEMIQDKTFQDIDINTALQMISNFRTEKSVRKAVYVNYVNQINNDYEFDPRYIDIYTKTIEDPNILVKFLALNTVDFLYSRRHMREELYHPLVFLKQYYTEKQIFKLFSTEKNDENAYLLRDALDMFLYDEETIRLGFRKTRCNVKSIHNEFVRCINEREYFEMSHCEFKYSTLEMQGCTPLSHNYKVRLPKSNLELYQWGEYMHNCIARYDNRIKNGETIIYGFFNDESLQFVAEIYNNKIVEASSRYNQPLEQDESSILQMWFNRFFTV